MPTDALESEAPASGGVSCCIGCGYDLRTLPPDANCPECGIPIARSTADTPLRFAPPSWLLRVASGFNWQIAANVCLLLYCLFYSEIRLLEGPLLPSLFLVRSVLDFLAVWYVTTPDPTLSEPTTPSLWQWARFVVAGAAALSIGLLVVAILQPERRFSGESSFIILQFLDVTMAWAGLTLWFVYVQRLASSAARPALALQWAVVMVIQFVSTGVDGVYPASAAMLWMIHNIRLPYVRTTPVFYASLGGFAYTCYLCWQTKKALRALAAEATEKPPIEAVSP